MGVGTGLLDSVYLDETSGGVTRLVQRNWFWCTSPVLKGASLPGRVLIRRTGLWDRPYGLNGRLGEGLSVPRWVLLEFVCSESEV
ncbi:predicted protein [Arabidopsis lyrata subsp. lyrata]|uniref:Predicted protein n=1 Tax=Arabidopsis lyrata subsp. lyrata TaxID=81972 RepID=D7M5C1_ARALL|nr:predicted protein [Arabidopsis lyrata subsp. lyrata]